MITTESCAPELFADAATMPYASSRRRLSRGTFQSILGITEFVADILTGAVSLAVAFLVFAVLHGKVSVDLHSAVALSVVTGTTLAILCRRQRSLPLPLEDQSIADTAHAIRSYVQTAIIVLSSAFLLHVRVPFGSILAGFAWMPLALFLQKQAFAVAVRHMQQHGVERIVVYGTGAAAKRMASAMLHAPRMARIPVAMVNENSGAIKAVTDTASRGVKHPVAFHGIRISADFLKALRCDLLLISQSVSEEQIKRLRTCAEDAGARMVLTPWDSNAIAGVAEGTKTADSARTHHRDASRSCTYTFGKRIIDIAISSLLLLLLSPLLLFLAFLIRFTSRGPALFVQERVGRNGSIFQMYKFRSMSTSAPRYECSPTHSHDPRITRIGRFLRRSSLDELPQLLNVFLGEMSLVGPRPEMPFIVRGYDTRQHQRLQVTPGLTGLWQLSGDRAYAIHENLHHDLAYIHHRSLALDLSILIHTLFFAMGGGI